MKVHPKSCLHSAQVRKWTFQKEGEIRAPQKEKSHNLSHLLMGLNHKPCLLDSDIKAASLDAAFFVSYGFISYGHNCGNQTAASSGNSNPAFLGSRSNMLADSAWSPM